MQVKVLSPSDLVRPAYFLILTVFIALSLYIAPYHEPWADEVQAFLIARDAGWSEILLQIPHQEGQPVLWHILLKFLILLFGEQLNITYVSIFVMIFTVGLIVFKYDIPFLYKLLLPFGYFFCYQYNIVARNYCLAYLALTIIGLCYKNRHIKIWSYVFSLAFLAETTSFYVPVAATLGCFYLYEIITFHRDVYKKYIFPLVFLLSIGCSILYQVLPINAYSYNVRANIPFQKEMSYNVIETSRFNHFNLFAYCAAAFFTSSNKALNVLFLLAFLICYIKWMCQIFRTNFSLNSSIVYMVILWIIFLSVLCLIYPHTHHLGLIWGLFLFSFYIFFPQYIHGKHYFLTAVLILHIYWTGASFVYDRYNLSSPQKSVVEILRKKELTQYKILSVGYMSIILWPLLPKDKLFGRQTTYYDHTFETFSRDCYPERLINEDYDLVFLGIANCVEDYTFLKKLKNYKLYFFKGGLSDKGNNVLSEIFFLLVAKRLLDK